MKVLHVISDRNIGGAGILLLNLLREFPRERISSVVALPEESLLLPRIQALGIRTVELRYPCESVWLRSVVELRRLMRLECPDLVHANAALSARIAAKLGGIPVIHTRHCCYPPMGALRFRPFRAVAGVINRSFSDLSIATADAAAENLLELGIPEERIRCIPNGSLPVREVSSEELKHVREKWFLAENDLCIGICARLEVCKGHDSFLSAAAELRRRLPDQPLRFLLAGDGTQRARLEALCEELGLAPFVRFLGFLEDTAPFYRVLDINVNCSVGTETSCLALSEGMSASLATVASDYGGNRAMLGNGSAGILFPAGDAMALADALEELIRFPSRRRELQRLAQERYEKHYTAARMAQATATVYEEVLKRKPMRGDRKVNE